MASNREEVELAFNIELQTRKAQGEITKLDKSLKAMVTRKLELKTFDKKALGSFRKELAGTNKDLKAIAKSMSEKKRMGLVTEFKEAEKASRRLSQTILQEKEKVRRIEQRISKTSDKDQKAQLQTALKLQRKESLSAVKEARSSLMKKRKVLSNKMVSTGATIDIDQRTDKAKKSREQQEVAKKAVEDIKGYSLGEDMAEGIKDGLDSLKGKDILGVGKAGLKLSASILKKGASIAVKHGSSIADKGAAMSAAGKAAGPGLKGIGMQGMGGMMKGIGGMMKSIGPLVGTLAKMGPLLSASAAIFAAIVKIALDAESAAKEMNKNLLDGASAAEFLYEGGKKSDGAFRKLDSTLDQVRKDATDIAENMKWGTKADDIIKTTNALAQQGITLKSMNQAFKNAGESSDAAARQVKGFGEMARMSFAYSRLMGVSINEITDLQAEMFTEMGTSLSGLKLEFARMTKEATESGMATNKFFAILRGVSSDLGLYTTRIGQAATMLKMLGKVMNPREAQKFMSALTQGMKGMSEEERLRMTLLAGEGKMKAIVTKDLERKTKLAYADMASAAGTSTDEVQKVVEDAQKGVAGASEKMEAMLQKVPEGQRAAFKSFLAEVKMDQNAIKKGGIMGIQEAAANLSAAGALTATKAALQRFGGGGKLRDMTGVQAFAARKAAGVSLEQFRGMAKLEMAVDDQKDEMVKLLSKPPQDLTEGDKQMIERMKAMGLTDEKAIKAADDADIIATMEKSAQDNLAASQEQTDYAAETFKATTSISDKMEMVIEGIFEFLYTKLKSILEDINEFIDLVATWWGHTDPRKEAKAVDDKLVAGKNAENSKLIDAMMEAGRNETDKYAKRAKWIETAAPALQQGMDESVANRKKTLYENTKAAKEKERGGKKLEGADLEAFNKEFEKTFSGQSIQQKIGPEMVSAFGDIFVRGFQGKDGGLDKDRVKEVADMDKTIDEKKREAFKKAIDAGEMPLKAIQTAGFNEDDVKKLMGKGLWGASPEELTQILPQMDLLKGKGPAKVAETTDAAKAKAAKEKAAAEEAAKAKAKGGTEAKPTAPGAPAPASPTGQAASTAKSADPGNAGAVTTAPAATPASTNTSTPGSNFSPTLAPMSNVNGPMMSSTPDKGTQEVISSIDLTGKDTVRGLQDLWDLMKVRGIRLNPQKFKDDTNIEKSVLDAVRVALFEFAVYTAEDPNKVLEQMEKSGLDAGKQAEQFKSAKGYKEGFLTPAANAEGGLVTSVGGGLATINPAPGEGLASIGKGERILPAGGGGGAGNITVNVNGIGGSDLANLIKAKVAEGVYEYKRREKFN